MSSLVTWIPTVLMLTQSRTYFNISLWSSTVSNIIWSDLINTWSNGGSNGDSKGFQFYQITCLECWRNIFLHILQRGKVFRPKNIKVSKQSNHAFTQASKGWHPWKEVYQMMRYRLGSWSLYTRSWYVCTILNFENGLIRHFILLKFPFTKASYKYGRPWKSFTYIHNRRDFLFILISS